MKIGPFSFEFYNPRRHKPVVYGIDHLAIREGESRPFAYADLLGATGMITDRLRNAEWHCDTEYEACRALFAFVRDWREAILQRMFWDGCVRVDVTDPFHPCLAGMRRDGRSEDDCRIVTVKEDTYRTTGKTMAEILRPQLDLLDTVNNADLNLLRNYGAMGLLSPESSAHADGYIDDGQMERLQEEYRRQYGVTFGKWGVLITRNPVKYQQMTLPIAALQLVEKRKVAVASILQFLGIPKELHVLFESAKYANRNEAEMDMYGNCVSAWAEKFCEILRRCYAAIRDDNREVGYVAGNEFWFDFTGVPALQEAQYRERVKAREEMAMWQEMLLRMPEKADYINERIGDLIESL